MTFPDISKHILWCPVGQRRCSHCGGHSGTETERSENDTTWDGAAEAVSASQRCPSAKVKTKKVSDTMIWHCIRPRPAFFEYRVVHRLSIESEPFDDMLSSWHRFNYVNKL